MSKQTPTPWSYTLESGPNNEPCYHAIRDMDGNYIAATWANTHEANAEFIVRACNSHYDLLEVAVKMLRAVEFMAGHKADEDPVIIAARAAIAKATGKDKA